MGVKQQRLAVRMCIYMCSAYVVSLFLWQVFNKEVLQSHPAIFRTNKEPQSKNEGILVYNFSYFCSLLVVTVVRI